MGEGSQVSGAISHSVHYLTESFQPATAQLSSQPSTGLWE